MTPAIAPEADAPEEAQVAASQTACLDDRDPAALLGTITVPTLPEDAIPAGPLSDDPTP